MSAVCEAIPSAAVRAPSRPDSGLLHARIIKLVESGTTRADEIDHRCRHAPFGMRFPTPAVRAALLQLVTKGVLVVDDSGPLTSYQLAVRSTSAPAHLPDHARGNYQPAPAPPRRANSDWRIFPSVIGGQCVPYRRHV